MRFAKIGLLAVVIMLAVSGAVRAQSGPTASGETGLFTLVTGDTLPAKEWSAGLYSNNWDIYTAALPGLGPNVGYETMVVDRTRFSLGFGYGVTDRLELYGSIPYDFVHEHNTGFAGNFEGLVFHNKIDESGFGTLHFAAKYALLRSERDELRLGLYGGVFAPTTGRNDDDPIQTGRWDYNVGAAFTAKFITFDLAYTFRGDRGDHRIADELRAGLGVEVPASQNVNVIMELAHLSPTQHCSNSPLCREAREQTDATAGIRWFVNDRLALNGGVRANLSLTFGDPGNGDHSAIGWVAGMTWYPRKKAVSQVETWGASGSGKGAKKIPPPPPVITVPVEGSTVATSTPSVAGTAEPNAKVALEVDGAPAGETTAGPSGAWSTSVGPLADGPHTVSGKQTAADTGLTSESSPATHFVVAKPVPPPPPPVVEKKPDQVTSDTVHFDPGSARLTNIAKAVLDQVAIRMKSQATATVAVVGHADAGEKGVDKLSLKRAEACRDYLVKRHGIETGRIAVGAKGSSEPAAEGRGREARKENRRAVIEVTVKGE